MATNKQESSKLIVGCGYLGRRVAARWRDLGCTVHAVTRSPRHAENFRQQGWEPILADVTKPDSWPRLPAVSTLLFAVGFDRGAGPSIHEVYVGGVAAVLDAAKGQFGKFIYVSSTGVYGGSDGGLVDENSPCVPSRDGGRACLAAEARLQASDARDRSIILRLAGIYGPERVPQRRAMQDGSFVPGELDRYLNLIHVDDAATCCLAADQVGSPPNVFNLSDGHPVLRRDYYEYLLARLDLPCKLLDRSDESRRVSGGRSDHRRISNQKMLAELGVRLAYPDYREGLRQILATGPANEGP